MNMKRSWIIPLVAVSAGLGILGGVGLLVAVYRPPAPEAADAS